MSDVLVLGRDTIGTVAESDGMRYYLTECCGASSKGMENYIGCRRCYREVDPELGDVPDEIMVFNSQATGRDRITFIPRPGWKLIEVYGDGIPYAEWKQRYLSPA